jgi:exopolysaccharide biosynthesis polyprenyl glycosylphosphotransferase
VQAVKSASSTGTSIPVEAAAAAAEAAVGGIERGRGWLMRRALLAADVVGLSLAFALIQVLSLPWRSNGDRIPTSEEIPLFILAIPVWVVAAKLYGLYSRDQWRTEHSTADDVVGVFHMVMIGAWLLFIAATVTDVADPSVVKLAAFCLLAIVCIPTARAGARALARRSVAYRQNTIVVGTDPVARALAQKFVSRPEYGIDVVGFIDKGAPVTQSGQPPLLGGAADLLELVQRYDVERVVFSFTGISDEDAVDLMRQLSDAGIQVDIVPRYYELVAPGVDIHAAEGIALVGLQPPRLSFSSQFLKRTMDLVVASAVLVVFAPFLLLAALAIRLDSHGPVFFRQLRIGRDGGAFRIWKLRTMIDDADERKADVAHLNIHALREPEPRMFKISDDPRVTKVGAFLRRYSLDELPQLFNVLRGEMSLVGPRPLIPEEDKYVHQWARRRLDLQPGMTGLWQVTGRSALSFDEMVRLDYVYVAGWSLWKDFVLLLRTIPLVFKTAHGE